MFAKIASFELRYQLRNPVFWVVAILFFLLTFGSMTVEQIRIGGGGNIHKNAPVAIAQTQLILSVFFMFVTTAFVANVIVRDNESGFGPMVVTTRVKKFDYLFARFLGAYLAAAISFVAVPLAIWLGSLMPWVDADLLGPNRWHDYAFSYLVFALPNLFLTSAIFFAVATMTRSMMYSYLGVVVFLVLWFVLNTVLRSKPELRELTGLVEPFGAGAFGNATRYWTATEANSLTPAFAGTLLVNRLIWIGVAFLALVIAYSRFSFAEAGISRRKLRRQARKDAKLAAAAPLIVTRLPALRPADAAWARFAARCRFEMRQVLRSPAFAVLMLVGLFNATAGLLVGNEIYGTPARPLTFATIGILQGAFTFIPLIIAIYYSGELVWRDRERKMHEIIDATSLPNWAYMVPKSLAVTAVLIATLIVSIIAAIIVQLARGQSNVELGQYFAWYLLPSSVDLALTAILAVFVQALSPNKYVGWGVMVIYLVATITLSNIGFEHPLYNYGSTGNERLSDMNGAQVGRALGWWLRLYWGAFAVMLAVLAHLLWRRGTEVKLMPRLRRLPRRLAGPAGAIMLAALLVFVATGGYLFWNMNILNQYRTQDDGERMLADYEKKYLPYEKVLQPSLTDITMNVALYPAERRAEFSGQYRFVNDTGAPVPALHVRLQDRNTAIKAIDVPGAKLSMDDAVLKYRIYTFATPLAPGATGTLTFRTERVQHGLRANGDDTALIGNGTFLNNAQFAPQLGMSRDGLLDDRVKRRKYGLEPELRMAKLEDTSAQRRNYVGDADWVHSDITLSTSADQVPIAPGRKVSDTIADGRRTAHFVSGAPILAFFSVQSARYAEKSAMADGVKLTVYYDPKHSYNVDRMLAAMRTSLGYYRAHFGPYQFDYARIIEFPGYATFAQAFAGTIPYSERIGFIADTRDAEKIDYVTYVTAHELGHQYWAHQLISADMQGGTIMVETMAQYSALMVMKHLYGEDKIRRFLKYELDNYLRSRGSERIEELPLDRVENQPYIHYRKGAVVMYLLQDRLGEDRVNHMLAGLLDKYRFKSQPYARSLDLVNGFLSLARTPAEHELVLDLLDRITIYDLKAPTATVRKLADGKFETSITIDAAKFYADGKGKERATPLADDIDIGLFDARPGLGAFAAKDVISMTRLPVKSGKQVIKVVSTRKPAFAGVDPYNKYIDRNADDNVAAVTG
ncbi:M1 family aminopeptidase [Sphingomonas sp. AR_OL41]|uniref:ABC transporter permease/M1 family aminopeptidase n=1 Tax=Sphingomonas sp. AR_OL41 TaxID=3042729 RepID=UPI002480C9E9|nr:M1 family aminopeptidase [Sphingomonas sp. AR_OL41]MDH7973589.1 M1 family aminopeptidase [Sphingomonas sp. AR_OL41]